MYTDQSILITLINDLKTQSQQQRFHSPDDQDIDSIWQLLYPEHFVNVLLIHHDKERKENDIEEVASRMRNGLMLYNSSPSFADVFALSMNNQHCRKTSKISDIFETVQSSTKEPKLILIDGAPGMGKTTLCKEIAYQWAEGVLLKNTKILFLVILRDPAVQKIRNLKDFIHYFYCFEPSYEGLSKQCAEILTQRDNSDITILMDGYDELSDKGNDILIKNIIKRRVLSQCRIVITSRSIASQNLQKLADVSVEVLGFTEQSKGEYIEKELKDYPEKIKSLLSYLKDHSNINNVCYIPIMMTIMVCTFKNFEELPNNQSELYERFVTLAISRYLQKLEDKPLTNTLLLSELPERYKICLQQLSEFAFKTIKSDKVMFSDVDIESLCPNLALTNKKFRGLGLFKATQHSSIRKISDCVWYNFLHLSIHEFLAAYYFSLLEASKQFQILEQVFFTDGYVNVWVMFVDIKLENNETCDFHQFLTYSHICKASGTVKNQLKLILQKLDSVWFSEIKNTNINKIFKGTVQLLCYKSDKDDIQANVIHDIFYDAWCLLPIASKWIKLFISMCSNDNDQLIETYFLEKSNSNILYCKLIRRLEQSQNLSVMLVSSDALVGYRCNHDQLTKGLNMNGSLKSIILRDCVINDDMCNDLSSYIANSHYLQCLNITNCRVNHSHLVTILQASAQNSKLKGLNLNNTNYKIDAQITKDLADVIESYFNLTQLALAYNDLGPFIDVILQALTRNTKLEVLNLNSTNITGQVAQVLANVIRVNSNLKYLDLGNNNLGPSAIRILQVLKVNHELIYLNLSSNLMTGQVVKDLAGVVKKSSRLEVLNLSDNDFKTSAAVIVEALKENRMLKTLYLNDNYTVSEEIAEDLAIVIKRNPNLEEVGISNNNLQSSATSIIQALKQNHKLKRLNLSKNNMTGKVAEDLASVIKNNSEIEALYLYDNDLQLSVLAILQALKENSKLKLLNLNNNSISDSELVAEELRSVIKNNPGITELSWSDNENRSSAAVDFKLLKETTILKKIDFNCKLMTEEIAEELASVIKNNLNLEEVFLADISFKKSATVILQAFRETHNLKALNLNRITMTERVVEDLAEIIKSNPNVKTLALHNNHLGPSAVKILQGLKVNSKLKCLNLNDNNMTGQVAKELAIVIKNNTSLEMLGLRNNQLGPTTVAILQALKNNTRLIVLDLSSSIMNRQAAENLADVIKSNSNIRNLTLSHNDLKLSALVILKALTKLSRLHLLNLNGNNMTGQIVKDLANVIKSNPNLEILNLGNNKLGQSANVILQALTETCMVKALSLSSNSLTGQVSEDLANAIKSNSSLTQLHLSDNDLRSSVIVILQALKETCKLEVLNLNNCNMTGQVAKDLADVIQKNSSLEELYLSNNNLKTSLILILKALKENSKLKVLSLNKNKMTELVAKGLANVIMKNSCLEELYISYNNFKSSIFVILQALEQTSSLKGLYLNGCNITGQVTKTLANVIKSNSGLEELQLFDNDLNSSVGVILQALKDISQLKILYLNNCLTESTAKELGLVIKYNPLITMLCISNNILQDGLIDIAAISCNSLENLQILELSHNSISPTKIVHLASTVVNISSLQTLMFAGLIFKVEEIFYLGVHQFYYARKQNFVSINSNFSDNDQMLEIVCLEIWRLQLVGRVNLYYSNSKFFLTTITTIQPILSDTKHDLNFALKQLKQKLSLSNATNMIISLSSIIKILKVLDLGYSNINKEAAVELATALNCNNVLEQLWLKGNVLGADGAAGILTSLQNITTLRVLDLSYNNISSTSANGIATVINSNHFLEQLWLDGNVLMITGVVIIAGALKKHSNLRLLSLSNNEITEDAAEEISAIVNNNTLLNSLLLSNNLLQSIGTCKLEEMDCLCTLELTNNCIDATVADKLAVTLSNFICLKRLHLGNNNLGTTGAVKICQVLKNVLILQVLSLNNNNIGTEATNEICNVINTNTNLDILLLGGNDLQTSGVLQIADTVKNNNPTMQLLSLSDNNVDEHVKGDIKVMLCGQCDLELFI